MVIVTSNLRIGGLASGMDTDSIIKDLMQARRIPVTQLEQQKQILEWQQEDYREINTTLRSFRDIVFDMKLQKTFLTKKVNSSDESIVTATANTSAIEGTHTITVKQLAKPAYLTGGELAADSGSSTLNDLGISSAENLIIQVNGQEVFNQEIDPSLTINELVNKINNEQTGQDYQIKASFDENLKRLFIMTTDTGSDQIITLKSTDADGNVSNALTNALKLTGPTRTKQDGQDAIYMLNGVDNLSSSTNNFTVNGINFDLKGADAGKEIYISVSKNNDAVFDAIVKFVDEYNKVTESVSDKLYEKRYRDYKPLTDEQREQLTDGQIDQWTEKARSGLLRNDSILSSVYSDMRMTMSKHVNVGGGYEKDGKTVLSNTLASIGITTTEDYMSGQLVINEEILREAVEKDPQGVMDLFTKSSDSDDSNEIGIATQLYENVNKAMKNISAKAGSESEFSLVDDSFIGKEIEGVDDRIEQMEDRLKQVEDRYWRQFTAMEKAIQQLNSQSTWLSQQFGIGG